jgi:hypothetical protein
VTHDEGYEAPAIEDRTAVTDPLNTTAVQSEPTVTPAWRRAGEGE